MSLPILPHKALHTAKPAVFALARVRWVRLIRVRWRPGRKGG